MNYKKELSLAFGDYVEVHDGIVGILEFKYKAIHMMLTVAEDENYGSYY